MIMLRNAVRARRLAAGMSANALAQSANLGRTTIGHIENGDVEPLVGSAIKLSRALGCAVEELFWYE